MSVHTTHTSSSHSLPRRREAATSSPHGDYESNSQRGEAHRHVRRNILLNNDGNQVRRQQVQDEGQHRPHRAIRIDDVHVVQEDVPPPRRQEHIAPSVDRNERIHQEVNHHPPNDEVQPFPRPIPRQEHRARHDDDDERQQLQHDERRHRREEFDPPPRQGRQG